MRIRLILSFLLFVVARSNANGQAALPPTGPAETSFANISTRGLAENSADGLIVGFVVAGEGFQPVLLRAVGPGLTAFGVGGAMSDPILKLSGSQGVEVARNDNWQEDTTVATHAARLGAFPLEPESRDAAIYRSLAPDNYTFSALADKGAGEVLLEAYDGIASPANRATRIVNLSSRGRVTNTTNIIAGFVVTGNAPKRVLIRGVGPGLGQFGLTTIAADTVLAVFSGSTEIARSDNWEDAGNPAEISAVAASVGAFGLQRGSKDAALLLSLGPGAYTTIVSAAHPAAGGIALAEVYECGDSVPAQETADGYGAVATGGAGGTAVTVTTAAQLRQYAESTAAYIITVSGTITLAGPDYITCKSNKTIKGLNTSATVVGSILINTGCTNVIVRNLTVTAPNAGLYRITMHHNWYSTLCKQRMPSCRFGNCHVYNNYFSCRGNLYCTLARNVGQVLAENNYYTGVNDPCSKVENGKLRVIGNIYDNCTGDQFTTQDTVFTPPYAYTLTATSSVPAVVQAGAGNI